MNEGSLQENTLQIKFRVYDLQLNLVCSASESRLNFCLSHVTVSVFVSKDLFLMQTGPNIRNMPSSTARKISNIS